ncbi:MAG: glutamate--tRNA ligase family protein, partial [Candidatus Nanoarchaeia archaeon]|nr:glutamate--tRNA ligase family protein [Candidatus Nanoarchaeia archaeon]
MNLRLFALKNAVLHEGKAAAGAIVPKALGENPELKNDMKKLMADINKAVTEVNKMSIDEQKKELLKLDSHALDKKEEVHELPEIAGIKKGKCSFRLPPGPEKQLHIGHALSFLLNDYYAKKYNGKLVLRFEDTNPDKCAIEYVKGIKEDLTALGIKWDEEYFMSDKMPAYYNYAESMIKNNYAYACICPKKTENDNEESFKRERCKCADNDVNWGLRHWNKMKYGTYKEGECVIRIKGDMKSKNSTLWDPIIFRINKNKHYRQGNKYNAWPMYDFTASIEDALVTHVLRDSNWTQRIELQNLIRERCGIKNNPENVLYSRYGIEGGLTQGRLIRKLVEDKIVEGYDDIRLSTVKGILRKGIQVETFKELLIELGLSKSKRMIPLDKIYSINRRILEKKVNHYQAIKLEDSMNLTVNDCPAEIINPLNSFSKNTAAIKLNGNFIINKLDKKIKNFRLKNGFNISIAKNDGKEATGEYKSGEFEKGMTIINWISNNNVKVNILEALPLINEKGEVNKNTLVTHELIIETIANELPLGSIVNFEKFGYCKKETNNWIFIHD